jgi:hypothetical protein
MSSDVKVIYANGLARSFQLAANRTVVRGLLFGIR